MYLKNLVYLIPITIYYLLEAFVIAIFVNFGWRVVIYPAHNEIYITYFQWVVIIWTIKMAFFDIFKLLAAIRESESKTDYNNCETEEETNNN